MILKNSSLIGRRLSFMRPALLAASGLKRDFSYTTLYRNTNQAQGLAEYAINFMGRENSSIDESVYHRVRLFHTDAVICGISALAMKTNAPNLLRREAIDQYSVSPDVKEKVNA